MNPAIRAIRMIGLILLVGGIASGGLGVYLESNLACEDGYGVTIETIEENRTSSSAVERLSFQNLSSRDQRTFEEILTSNTTQVYHNASTVQNISNKEIEYKNTVYITSGLFVTDCFSNWRLYKAGGGLVAFVGGCLTTVTIVWQRRS
ncbi:hypothetical protein SAMN05443574_110124 [Haloarcula vallismortis]|uniref:Uncharacterized protein n=1 Tax=Haloarcula vallismortis TaxID=28442 RepID=A0A1H2XUG4_HALVA|nr:hypothetical protein SAMN05443574_110124 [Haloarcula vallismortis]